MEANLSDVEVISTIYLDSRKRCISFAPLIHSDESIHKWVREILIPTSQLIVAEADSVVIGMMALSKKEGIGWIDQLYIVPENVSQGIGTLLVKAAKVMLGSPIRLHTFFYAV